MNGVLFHATTLALDHWELASPQITRTRLLNMISNANILPLVVGPMGSGKSTIALQWASELGTDVVYLSARDINQSFTAEYAHPSLFGTAIQEFLNLCLTWEEGADDTAIRRTLHRVEQISYSSAQSVILDDIEIIPAVAQEWIRKLLSVMFTTRPDRDVLLCARNLESSFLEQLRTLRPLRMLLPHMLGFDADESYAARAAGVFGDSTKEQVEWARERSAGWITGMLLDLLPLGTPRSPATAFQADLVNKILLTRFPEALVATFATAYLPFSTMNIWEQWFTRLGIPHDKIGDILSEYPVRFDPHNRTRFDYANPFSEIYRELRGLRVSKSDLIELLTIAVEWYVREGIPDVALQVATEHGIEHEYLKAVRPQIVAHARDEDWESIADLIRTLPLEVIAVHPDILFWNSFAMAGAANYSGVIATLNIAEQHWKTHDDPIIRGLHRLLLGFNQSSQGMYHEALDTFEEAYELFPASLHHERHFAAASADLAAVQLNNRDAETEWKRRSAYEHAHLPRRHRWWHSNGGPLNIGVAASRGHLNLAYEQAEHQVRSMDPENQDLSWRYLLLMANFDIERLRLDSAAELLKRVEPHLLTELHKAMWGVEQSRLLLAQGEFEQAKVALLDNAHASSTAINSTFRAKMLETMLAYESGDLERAEYILTTSAWTVDRIPRNFADAHPLHLRALIHADKGEFEDAILYNRKVLDEATSRHHRYLMVRSHVIFAHIYALTENTQQRNAHIQKAVQLDSSGQLQHVYFIRGFDMRELLSPAVSPPQELQASERLTERESEILKLVSDRLSNKQIADQLFISLSTVKNHLANIYEKLGTNRRQEAVRLARARRVL